MTAPIATRAAAAEVIADITHDARGAVGTIRLAVTTLLETDNDAALREQLLRAVDEEAGRLVAELSAAPALVAASLDTSLATPVDLIAALDAAATALRTADVIVRVTAAGPLLVRAREDTLVEVLTALLRVAASRGADEVIAGTADGTVEVRFSGATLGGRLVHHLIAAITDGPVRRLDPDGFAVPLMADGPA